MKLKIELVFFIEHPNARKTKICTIPHISSHLYKKNRIFEFDLAIAYLDKQTAKNYKLDSHPEWIKYNLKKL